MESALAEISNGTIQFSKAELLNDPLEGFISFYWEGDRPAWEGFFRNFVDSLFVALNKTLLGSEEKIDRDVVLEDIHQYGYDIFGNPRDIELDKKIEKIGNAFLDNKSLWGLIDYLAEEKIQLSKSELSTLLYMVLGIAVVICVDNIIGIKSESNKLLSVVERPVSRFITTAKSMKNREERDKMVHKELRDKSGDLEDYYENILRNFYDDNECLSILKNNEEAQCMADIVPDKYKISKIEEEISKKIQFKDFIQEGMSINERIKSYPRYEDAVNDEITKKLVEITKEKTEYEDKIIRLAYMENWVKIKTGFPGVYINNLIKRLHPLYYITCFSACETDSSMWGTYADSHKGICIEYTIDDGAKFPVHLADRTANPSLPPQSINYDGHQFEMNFFDSMGCFPEPVINNWLTGRNGKRSKHFNFKCENNNEEYLKWHKQYWDIFNKAYTQKMNIWSHEKEYRILIPDEMYMFDNRDKIYPGYDTKALTGIIFGINTSIIDQLKVIDVVKKKFGNADSEIKYYQEVYDDEKYSINIRKKDIK